MVPKAYMSKSLDSGLNLWKHFCEFQHKSAHSNAWIGKGRLVASRIRVLLSSVNQCYQTRGSEGWINIVTQ